MRCPFTGMESLDDVHVALPARRPRFAWMQSVLKRRLSTLAAAFRGRRTHLVSEE